MTERQARKSGFGFTGIYGRDREEIKKRRDEEFTKKGYKAYVVTVPDSPLSRGPKGTGYSVYAEPKYFRDKRIEELKKWLNNIEPRRERAKEKYQIEIDQIEYERMKIADELLKLLSEQI